MFDGGLLSIGELARASGLPVSALRFYDGAGVLTPVRVEAHSGYRRYGPEQVADARLLARLRRVGMPLAQMRLLLASRHDRRLVSALVAEHLARLEAGLADARRELEYVMSEADPGVTTFRVAVSDLRRALAAVRFALPPTGTARSTDAARTTDRSRIAVASGAPSTSGASAAASGGDPGGAGVLEAVLFEVDAEQLTLVATDRYRMAVSSVPVTDRIGPAARLPVPCAELARIADLSGEAVDARIDGDTLHLGELAVTAQPGEYPAYQAVMESVGGRRVPADAAQLRARLTAGPVRTVPECPGPVAELGVDATGALAVVDDADGFVAVDRDFLLAALDAAPAGQLVLDFNGPRHPLAIRRPDDPTTYSVLMPVRLP